MTSKTALGISIVPIKMNLLSQIATKKSIKDLAKGVVTSRLQQGIRCLNLWECGTPPSKDVA